MKEKPLLRDLVQRYFRTRLIVPLGALSVLALIAVTALQLQKLYKDHAFFVKTIDRYTSVLFSGAHSTLRQIAFSAEESGETVRNFAISSPLAFHRVFVFEAPENKPSDFRKAFTLPPSVDIPLSLFPDPQEWPALSNPYFSSQLKNLTVAVMVRAHRFFAFGELNLDCLEHLIREFSQSAPENLVLVLDRFGNVIYHPDPSLMRSQENLGHEPLVKRALIHWQPRRLIAQYENQYMFAYCWRVALWDWVIIVGTPVVQTLLPPLLWALAGVVGLWSAVFALLIAFKRHLDRIIVHPIVHMKSLLDAFASHRNLRVLEQAADTAPFLELDLFARELHHSSQAVMERESALVAQGREIHRILESIEDAVIVTDSVGRITRINAKAEELTGWTRTQASGRPSKQVVMITDPKSGKQLEDLVQKVVATGSAHKTPAHGVLHAADGSLVIVSSRAAPVRNDTGAIQGVVMILSDATAEYEAKTLMEESERKYREIMESMEEAYMELDPTGRVTFCNPALLKILGCSWEELQDRTYPDFTDAPTAEKMRAFFSEIFASGSSLGLQDFVIHDAQGRRKTVEISAGVRRAEDGRKIGFRVLARDITEKAQAQERSRTLEKMLMHTQKMESLGTLASGIAHEFNNLLQAMSGYLEMALKHTDPQDRRSRWLTRVQEAAFKARDLIRRLLSFARQTEPILEPVDFNAIVEETLELLKKSIPRMIEIQKDLGPHLPVLVADRLQMEQVVINLTANARDAIGSDNDGVIRVRTGTYSDDYGRAWIRLEVSDTGAGIPKEIQERIFDPFFTTKEPGKGTGLGLSTVYGIVTAHGGRITCESRLNHGTTFFVDFPVRPWVTKDAAHEAEGETPEETEKSTGATLLVVDDEEALLELIHNALESEGYTVKTARSGEDALTWLSENHGRVDAVVLDLSMPGMGGRQCLHILSQQFPHIPVIVASGDAAHEIVREPAKFRVRGAIVKPYRLKSLLKILHDVLKSPAPAVGAERDGA